MSELFEGLAYLGNWAYWLAFGVAILTAVLVRLLPGVSTNLVLALAMPFIVANVEDALIGIVMLTTFVGVGVVMRSFTPVLFGLPSSSSYVTFLEGNQLARRGQAAHTLGAAYAVSAIEGLVGVLVFASALLIGAPLVRPFLGAFEGMEFVAIALFGLVIVALLYSEAMLKGLAAAALGLLLGTSGLDPFEGPLRSVFDGSDQWCPASSILAGPASISFAGSPPFADPVAGPRRCGSWRHRTPRSRSGGPPGRWRRLWPWGWRRCAPTPKRLGWR